MVRPISAVILLSYRLIHEIKAPFLEGRNENYEDLPAKDQNLTFHYLENILYKYLNIEHFSEDVLKTLGLYYGKTYNIATEFLADENSFPDVDLVRFGDSINKILMRKTLSHISILKAFIDIMKVFRDYYTYEIILGFIRKKVETIPEEAFREAIATAFIQREWNLPSSIQISMFDDHIEITSPGGLPVHLSKYAYLHTMISNVRNPKIADIFYKTHLIEMFGTGIIRIKRSYNHSMRKPIFHVNANSTAVNLPLIVRSQMRKEQMIINELEKNGTLARSDLEKLTGFKTDKILRLLNKIISSFKFCMTKHHLNKQNKTTPHNKWCRFIPFGKPQSVFPSAVRKHTPLPSNNIT